MKNEAGSMQAISRASTLLRIIAATPTGVTLGELSARSSLPRSTVHRVLKALETEGFVAKSVESPKYRIGIAASLLASASRARLLDVAGPPLAAAAAELGIPVELYILAGGTVRCVDQVFPPSDGLRPVGRRVGLSVAAHATAPGKAICAHLEPPMSRQLAGALPSFTIATITDIDELLSQFERIRATGIAWERDEATIGASSVAVGFVTPSGDVVAASVALASEGFAGEAAELVPALMNVRDRTLGTFDAYSEWRGRSA